MTVPIFGDIIREVGGVVRELIPDADKRMEIDLHFAELADQAQAREAQLLQGQVEVNKAEAASGNVFVAGWRPFIGWVCGSALAYTWIVAPVAQSVFHLTDLPIVPADQMYPVVMAMLGVSIPRTIEKISGVASGQLGKPPPPVASTSDSTSRKNPIKKIGKWFK